MRRITSVESGCCVLLATVVLAGCTDYGTRQFGVRRDQQGQTRVTTPPPLSMPPILTERETADKGGPAPGTQASALAASVPRSGASAAAPSPGEATLLDAAGPSAPADIRQKVDQDAQIGRADPGLSNALLFGPAGTGQTAQQPIIQRESKSWLDRIF